MKTFDSLTLKYFFEENRDFILGSVVQKIQLPSRHEIILNLRNINLKENKKLYININPKYPHISFISDCSLKKRAVEIPKNPPMFCMQLRKYINGSKIQDFKLLDYERILEFYFDYFDEIGSLTKLCLCVELMGKYSNIILYNAKNHNILGSIHNISKEKSSIREVYGGAKYIYPILKQKLDILHISFNTFNEMLKNINPQDSELNTISDNFYYFSRLLLKDILKDISQNFPLNPNNTQNDAQKNLQIFQLLQNLAAGKKKDLILNFWQKEDKEEKPAQSISQAIEDYFSEQIFLEVMENKKKNLKKILEKDIKKLSKIVSSNIDFSKAEKYKQIADILTINMYKIKGYETLVEFDNIKIDLDNNLTLNQNIQKYYALYKKQKIACEFSQKRAQVAKEKLEYYDTIMFSIENAANFSEIDEIESELSQNGILNTNNTFKASKKSRIQKEIQIKKLEFQNYTIYLGKNNKQNDYLVSKIADNEDIWFHVLNEPSAHVVLKIKGANVPPKEVMEFCAKLTKENSKAKNSNKTSIIYTKRKNLKKPPNTYPGYVTYKNEKEIVI